MAPEQTKGRVEDSSATAATQPRCPATLSTLHEAVERGEIPADVARERLARIGRMPIRLLGDAVLRRRAWDLADQLGWASTYNAEYVALTQLQADALVTLRRCAREAEPRNARCAAFFPPT